MDETESSKGDSKPNGCLRNSSSPPVEIITINNNETTDKYCSGKDGVISEDKIKGTELNANNKEIRKKKHHKAKKERLHVQFHQDETTVERSSFESSTSSSSESSESSSEESSQEHFSETQAPDGGWGWVVVFSSFLVNMIADGVTFSFGVIYVEFLQYFGDSKSKTACIGSLFMAMPLLSGPIASILTDRFGCRRVSIFGSILASLGFVVSCFTDSIEVLFLTFGVISGFGLSLCYVASVVIVAYYFEKRRSFATGLSFCGSGIGTFAFAPLTQYLLEEYGWRGTTLILAGFFLNMCVCGALMRDLPWTATKFKEKLIENRKKRRRKRIRNRSCSSNKSLRTTTSSGESSSLLQPSADELKKMLTSGRVPLCVLPRPNDAQEDVLSPPNIDSKCTSLVNIPNFIRSGERVPLEALELLTKHKNIYKCLVQNYPNLLVSSRSCSDLGLAVDIAAPPQEKAVCPVSLPRERPNSPKKPPLPGKQWWVKRIDSTQKKFSFAYLKNLRVHRHSLTYRGAMLNINRYRLRASSCPDIFRNSMTTIAEEKDESCGCLYECWDLLVMLDFSHFLDARFLFFAISNFLLYTWYDVPYVYLADNAIERGFSKAEAPYLISVIGILNMIGEIAFGWVGDRFNANIAYAVCMFFCGAATGLIPLLSSRLSLYTASGAFGFFIAANCSLTSIILVDLITIEKFTNAYGLLLLVQGIANLVGPPLAGWIYDVTNSYDISFYVSGIFISISGVILLILPAMNKLRRYRREKSGLGSYIKRPHEVNY
ncbi:hypothetical protein RUM43_004926 [Polyplax serrata]|uniref:Major facilitator superfamily (MFS) profile domain-containing protein n=1 Tax=Polyplax serrata TaxID=468196 RepID=A0AAN8XP00_POLSC